ncbi:Phosphoribosylaminoimidazolesuccinocarboxamide synthase [Streptococcus parauberis]|uniref:Phosphoribosylaminoimidazole-succinocarboxamide synthase n=1 Tax=Streptococcus parauberis KRS-02083 TaxID=1207545 RepID=A0ABN0IR88_9STRE|nr:phosphoribosylaminoimidazolesuccinocarboxamide synthase [Streptococcus parauberis]AUT06771.1 Phosphoribosylaminoimidazolesuccinocarboxamide synthase [Streptococcus parauberis]EMG25314.1 Phosphoribosylaminoimidazole-succinocarboxamide synthase [Streptococcus parauberis KRS-02083]UWV10134.1 phosphoribosylaminoimidazolesuccinocarboxamide synthase [Streptococcus parauberis]WEM61578.1 phosphoribosylaminoimidazolesuccinocarboxamide synthase [Streptococcus parauberis]WEM64807.1 phosphoribosylamino
MEKIYTGKTKDVFEIDDKTVLLHFKDDVTGKDGVFDPGENQVGLQIEGAGRSAISMTQFFYQKLNELGLNTHFVSADLAKNEAVVRKAKVFGKGLEVIVRYRAVGSFIRRYGDYIESGTVIPPYVEVTLKDDKRNDPLITADALDTLNILSLAQYDELKQLALQIGEVVKAELAKKDLELYDIKFEFGEIDGKVALIDEISGGNMRAYKDGECIPPLDLEKLLLG